MIYYQIGAVVIVLLFIIIGAIRGIARTLLNIAGLVLNAFLSYYISTPLAQGIYDTFMKQAVIAKIQEIIAQNGVSFVVDNATKALPDWLSGAIGIANNISGQDLGALAGNYQLTDSQTLALAQSIEQELGKLAVSVLSVILVFVLFFIFMIFIKLLIRLILKAMDAPGLRTINRVLGGVLGAVEGCGIVFLLCLLFNINLFTQVS